MKRYYHNNRVQRRRDQPLAFITDCTHIYQWVCQIDKHRVNVAAGFPRRLSALLCVIFSILSLPTLASHEILPNSDIIAQSNGNSQLPHFNNKSAISSTISTITNDSVVIGFLAERAKRKSADELVFPQPAKTFFDENNVNDKEVVEKNFQLKSLNMFKDPIIDITSERFDHPNLHDQEAKINEVNRQHLLTGTSTNRSNLRTKEELLEMFGSLLPKITSFKVDNFDELYQLFNSTYFRMAHSENAIKDHMPYPSIEELKRNNMIHKHSRIRPQTKKFRPDNILTPRDQLHVTPTKKSMRDYFRALISDKHQHASGEYKAKSTDAVDNAPAANSLAMKHLEPPSKERDNIWQERKNDVWRFSPRLLVPDSNRLSTPSAVTASLEDDWALKTRASLFPQEATTIPVVGTTMPTATLPTTSLYLATNTDASEVSNDLSPWEQRRENGNDDFDVSAKITYGTNPTKFIDEEPTITANTVMKARKFEAHHSQKFDEVTHALVDTASTTETSSVASSSDEEPQSLATLMPFPPIIPGQQFYVDQHVSYGHFGRYADSANNVVYDPNVLQNRYNFGRILPSVISTTSPYPDKSRYSIAANADKIPRAMPALPLVTQFEIVNLAKPRNTDSIQFEASSVSAESTKYKSAMYGVKNMPNVLQALKPTYVDHPTKTAGLSAFDPGAKIFFIPTSKKLSVAKAVPLRVHEQVFEADEWNHNVSMFQPPYDSQKNMKVHNKSITKGLLLDASITESRHSTLLSRLNLASNDSSNDAVSLFSNSNADDRTLVRVVADKSGNPLNWRLSSGSGTGSVFHSRASKPSQFTPVSVPQFVAPLEPLGQLTTTGAVKSESVDKSQCYASEHLNDASKEKLSHIPMRLTTAVQKCFNRAENCVLQDAQLLERRINFSEHQCIIFCGSHSYCISITYSRATKICDVFNVRNGTGVARLYQHQDFRYYEMRRGSNIDNGDNDRRLDCWKENSPFYNVNPLDIPIDSLDVTLNDSNELLQGELQSNESGLSDKDRTLSTVSKDSCPGSRDIIVFKSAGYRLLNPNKDLLKEDRSRQDAENLSANSIEESSTELTDSFDQVERPLQQTSSETECIFSCLINLARGTTPYECMAATYNTVDNSCMLYSMGDNLNGNIHLIPDSENNHYEKGCITMDLVDLCKGYPIIRHAQKTLLGFAMASRFAASFVECIEMCFADRQNARQQNIKSLQNRRYCKSIMYFYEKSTNKNCILNSENRESAPAFFVDENEALVDYASFESCYEMHADMEDSGKNSEETIFTDLSTTGAHIPIDQRRLGKRGEARHRAQTTLYMADSGSRAKPIDGKRQPTLNQQTWSLVRELPKNHYADSKATDVFVELPKARIKGKLSGLHKTSMEGNIYIDDSSMRKQIKYENQVDMSNVLRRSIRRIKRRWREKCDLESQ